MAKTQIEPWASDIDPEKVSKAVEVPPRIDLPNVDDPFILVDIKSEPESVDVPDRDDTMLVVDATRVSEPEMDGTMILPKSLRFNMAKEFSRHDKDFTTTPLTGTRWRIWSTLDKGNKYYQAEFIPNP